MTCDEWRPGPYGLDAAKGTTLAGRRTVLVVVHHLTAATRLADVVPLVEGDRRIQVVYTESPASVLRVGVGDHLRGLGGLLIPYHQAIRTSFDLAIAAGDGRLQDLHAPVLTLPHGAPPGVLVHRWAGRGPAGRRPLPGLRADAIAAGGRVIPSALAVAHESQVLQVGEVCPDALPVTFVAGDPTFDRMLAGAGRRAAYRQALGAGPDQTLVFVSSTWGPRSLLGRHDDLPLRLARELPSDRYRIVVAFHPNIWCWHGRRQVAAWFEDCRRLGVRILPPEQGWQAALVAADRLIGDHGSVTGYGAALGVPTLLAAFPDEDVMAGSAVALLGRSAPRLDQRRPLEPQIAACAPGASAALRSRLTSRPGQAAAILRRRMYELLQLPEPPSAARVEPVAPPRPLEVAR
ncbi:hypothetical protein [Actinoallomurus rhizosphaericola]|uniref:hypothetical protein n=1 Tax=Actinoallomurus rhizosphaericola TaxID=2952536 RepID=UPI0020926309|nr:hypothetical protein [Actinoallomurus rhizosphaericola]MCO5999422.1 hypothetical protein [Actinoallomurus rhizosphaericola]